MKRKNITAASILFFLMLFSGMGDAICAEGPASAREMASTGETVPPGATAAFTLESVMGEARLRGEGVIDFSSPDRLAVSFHLPREIQVVLRDSAARVFREILAGKRAEICVGVTVNHAETQPRVVRIDFPHGAFMALTLEPGRGFARAGASGLHGKGATDASLPDAGLYDAVITEKGRAFPFFCVVTKNRAGMFSTSLLPLGWIDLHEGKPGEITRVIPDEDAVIPLQRLAEALAAGGLADYKGRGWKFSCSPFAKGQREDGKE